MSNALSTFTAYIDESGCAGNKFGEGSSEFLTIGAVIVRDELLDSVMGLFDAAREAVHRTKKFHKFSNENDKNRFALTRLLGQSKVATCLVGIHKPSMRGSYIRENHANEYNYLLKMLIERISWTVRDAKTLPKRGNGPCRLVLSEQRMYPYSEMFAYFEKLKRGAHNCSADWKWIAEELPDPIQHEDEHPIHLGDLAASAFAMAIEPKTLGMTDDRFLRNLSPTIYQKYGKRFGFKLFPDNEMRERAEALQRMF